MSENFPSKQDAIQKMHWLQKLFYYLGVFIFHKEPNGAMWRRYGFEHSCHLKLNCFNPLSYILIVILTIIHLILELFRAILNTIFSITDFYSDNHLIEIKIPRKREK